MFRKDWVLAILIILLAVETTILIFIAVEWSLGNQSFPPVSIIPSLQLQCPALTSRVVFQNSENRTVLFDCSGTPGKGAALSMYDFSFFPERNAPIMAMVPVFSLPPGYLKLSLTLGSLSDCSYPYETLLKSGETVILGGGTWSYDYCGVISNSAGTVNGFNIKWHPTRFPPPPPPPPFFELYASPVNITIPAGQVGSSTLFVTSLRRFNGTVGFWGVFNYPYSNPTGEPTLSFAPTTVLLRAGGSNSTIVTVTTFSYTPRGLYLVSIFGQSGSWNATYINVNIT